MQREAALGGQAGNGGVHDAADELLVGEPRHAREDAEVGVFGPQSRQRIDLQKLRRALLVTADVHAPAVAAVQRAPGAQRHVFHLLHQRRRMRRPVFVGDAVLVVVLVGERIDALFGLGAQEDLHDADHAGLAAAAGDAHGEFPSGQIGLDEDGLPEALHQLHARCLKLAAAPDDGLAGAALARALCRGLHEIGRAEVQVFQVALALEDAEIAGGDARVADHVLGHAFVQGHGQGQRRGEDVGDAVEVENGGHLGFAGDAVHALADVEDEAPEGYVLNNEKMYFSIKEDGKTIKSNVKDKKITGTLEITKLDVSTSEPLPNTLFEIYDAKTDELLFSERTDDKGQVIIPNLVYGDYYAMESEAPEGYILNDEKMYFSIKEDGQVVKATFTDEKIIVEVPKTALNDSIVLDIVAFALIVAGIGYVIYDKKKNK